MIDAGLPKAVEDWPAGVLDAIAAFRQGSIFRASPGLYWADPSVPIHSQTAAYAPDEPGSCEFDDPFPYGMVLSQTCDLVEEEGVPRFPWVEVCPVYPADWLPADRRGNAIRGRVLYLVPVQPEDESGNWVADLRLRVSVEKGWLAHQTPLRGFEDEEARRKLGKLLAWRAERPAFDRRFVLAIQIPLIKRLQAIRSDDPDLFTLLNQDIAEFGIRATDHVSMTDVELHALLNAPVSGAVQSVLANLWDEWESASREHGLNLLPLQTSVLSEMTAAMYLSLQIVPLRGISPEG